MFYVSRSLEIGGVAHYLLLANRNLAYKAMQKSTKPTDRRKYKDYVSNSKNCDDPGLVSEFIDRDLLMNRQPDTTGTVPVSDNFREEIGGPAGPEPTRYGDWEKNGRCIDF